MKKWYLFLIFACNAAILFGQAGQKWSLTGNSSTSSDFLGTTNSAPLIIKTNNTPRLTIGADGAIYLNSFSQMPAGVLRFNTGGELQYTALTNNSNEVLTGNGTFRNIQGMDLGWKVTGTSKIYCESSFNVGIGTGNPAAALDVNGTRLFAEH